MKHYRRFLHLLAMLSVATFASAQNETKDYQVSGVVPDGISKVYIYKSNGLSSPEMLDSVVITDGRFTMSGTRPAYDLLSLGTKGIKPEAGHNVNSEKYTLSLTSNKSMRTKGTPLLIFFAIVIISPKCLGWGISPKRS